MKRTNKARAMKELEKGNAVYILASKLRLGNMWTTPCRLVNNGKFDEQVNMYKYYNCNEETGKGVYYYLPY